MVAVKVLAQADEILEMVNNEVNIFSRVRHQNLVTFYGCTKPERKLLLVFEFVPNHDLEYHLHRQILPSPWLRKPFPWLLRIQIAIDIAEALSYLHSRKFPIIHRDVKSSNILLDDNFRAKLADFQLCRMLPSDNSVLLSETGGTIGYRDPEHDQNFIVNDKNDVFSFGVVLVELISRKKAVDVRRDRDKIYLVDMIMNNKMEQLVDPDIGYSDADAKRIIDSVAELACKCLQPTGVTRPSMAEVLRVLKDINCQMQDVTVFGIMKNETHLIQRRDKQKEEEVNVSEEDDFSVLPNEDDSIVLPNEDDSSVLPNESARIYDYNELKKATNSFNPSQQLSQFGYGKTYSGKLRDGQMVAVMVVFNVNQRRLKQIFNEATALSRLRHDNLVTLYGCTNPQGEELLLVYEIVTRGNVAHHIHGARQKLPWNLRIQIALETAEVLAYLHALEPPVMHHELKTSNILLDHSFHVKIADLGLSSLLLRSNIHTTMQRDTVGHQDPEFGRTFRLTDKSDVYSFGVVLFELISGKPAIDLRRNKNEIRLVQMALDKMINKKLDEFVDAKLEYHSNTDVMRMINAVAELARTCVQQRGDDRPLMMKVLQDLKDIRGTL